MAFTRGLASGAPAVRRRKLHRHAGSGRAPATPRFRETLAVLALAWAAGALAVAVAPSSCLRRPAP